jgi:UDP-glucose 4-epimerase
MPRQSDRLRCRFPAAPRGFQLTRPMHRPSAAATALLQPSARVLVTGGAGFIGSHLAELLIDRGHAVHVVDDLSSGRLENVAALRDRPGFRLTVASVADADVAAAICRDADCVFHLAGEVGVRRLAEAPLSTMARNLRSTDTMLDAAAASGRPILIASSSEVYGQGPVPFRESDPVRPGTPEGLRGGYACAKAMGEWLAMAHAAEHGLPVVVCRLFNTVGPRQSGRHGMVLPRFVQQALAGEPITVFGDGMQTRCFAHVSQTVRALFALAATEGAAARIYNVGSDREIRVKALAELVRAIAGSSSPIECVPLESVFPRGFVDPPRRVPCLERLQATIGFVPDMPIEAIVGELLALQRTGELLPVG